MKKVTNHVYLCFCSIKSTKIVTMYAIFLESQVTSLEYDIPRNLLKKNIIKKWQEIFFLYICSLFTYVLNKYAHNEISEKLSS